MFWVSRSRHRIRRLRCHPLTRPPLWIRPQCRPCRLSEMPAATHPLSDRNSPVISSVSAQPGGLWTFLSCCCPPPLCFCRFRRGRRRREIILMAPVLVVAWAAMTAFPAAPVQIPSHPYFPLRSSCAPFHAAATIIQPATGRPGEYTSCCFRYYPTLFPPFCFLLSMCALRNHATAQHTVRHHSSYLHPLPVHLHRPRRATSRGAAPPSQSSRPTAH